MGEGVMGEGVMGEGVLRSGESVRQAPPDGAQGGTGRWLRCSLPVRRLVQMTKTTMRAVPAAGDGSEALADAARPSRSGCGPEQRLTYLPRIRQRRDRVG
jgi:hypothetical protein